MGYLIKFLFIAIIVLWVVRLLLRIIFPIVVRKAFGNMQQPNQGAQRPVKPEGTISIDHMPQKPKKKGNADNLGEFVDYEEVK